MDIFSGNCIYYKNLSGQQYKNREHVIPAGIGGIEKLPSGWVSDEFNNRMSKSELVFMRNSIIALPRQTLGPGKRGSQKIADATKSKIHLIEDTKSSGSFALSYIERSAPFIIPQVKINLQTGELLCSFPETDDMATAKDGILKFLKELDPSQLINIDGSKLEANELILGYGYNKENRNYIATSHSVKINVEFLELLVNSIEKLDMSQPGKDSTLFKTHQEVTLDNDFYKVCAKTAFNTLAMLKGHDFVMQDCFDPLRNWITGSGKGIFATFSPITKDPGFPEDSHWVVIDRRGRELIAIVTFYNHFSIVVNLTADYSGNFTRDGYICEWSNKKEYLLRNYITQS